jgi:DNA (cytosine-5)-methyltransferase 1
MAIYTGNEPKNIALFAGVGGGELAAKYLRGWRTVCYVEHNPYAVDVLQSRMRDGYLDYAPIWDDCFTFDGYPWRGRVDIISAGFPCQPFSQAGKGLSERDPRNGWPATIRIIDEVRPSIAWLENVPGLISKFYIRRIFGELAEIGYDAEWGCLSAQAVGANHERERLWILAYPHGSARTLSNISR